MNNTRSMQIEKRVKKMNTAIVLFSGGIDSTACFYWAKEKYDKIILLSFTYGSKEDEVIANLNNKFSSLFEVKQKIISLPFLQEFSERVGSRLTATLDTPPILDDFNQLDDKNITEETAKEVWVPGRNILFLSIASSFADSFEEPVDIIFGANREEGETFPDNTLEFVNRMNDSTALGCLNEIKIIAPFHDYDKKAIVSYLNSIEAKIEFSSSCYNVQKWSENNQPIHCGKCESCLRRKRAFELAEVEDPTKYE